MPNGISQVPKDREGLYSFSLRLPSNYEFGLNRQGIERVKHNVISFLSKWEKATLPLKLHGKLRDSKSYHLRSSFIVKSEPYSLNEKLIRNIIDKVNNESELSELLTMLRELLNDGYPIYIGMAERQSLHTRVSQHLAGETGFSKKLFDLGFQWNNIYLKFAGVAEQKSRNLRDFEVISQLLLKPQLSLR